MNKNNYISLDLPDDFRKELFDIVTHITHNIKTITGANVVFKPMSYDDLHMTIVFLGDKLKHSQKLLVKENVLDIPTLELKFDSYELFPPNKKNLIVAKFLNNKMFDKLLIKLRQHLKDLNILTPDNNVNEQFIPHITLGKIMSLKEENKTNTDFHQIKKLDNLHIDGYHLCGNFNNNNDRM